MASKAVRAVSAGLSAAVTAILLALAANEGGHVDHPSDPGGETNHGITRRVAAANGYTGPMRALPIETARAIYVREYMERPGFLPIVERSAAIGEELVDTGVNAGPGRAACWLQESLNHLNGRGRDYPDLPEDCRIGPATVAALEALQRRRGRRLACELVIKLVDAKQAGHYMRLAGRNAQFEDFVAGWVRTRIGNVHLEKCA